MISICSEFEDGMAEALRRAQSLNWQPLANADYPNWGHLVQEIEWVLLASHDPFSGQNANINALVQMKEAIATSDASARSYIASAPQDQMLGDDTRRLFNHPDVDRALIAVLIPGGYGSNAECTVISEKAAPKKFLELFAGLNEVPPENSLLTAADVRAAAYPRDGETPQRVFVVREFDRERLGAFTEYRMNVSHSFELRLFAGEVIQ
ncbi:MAG: hypothetical protein AAGO57_00060 [Pseudomonadota bacterium]